MLLDREVPTPSRAAMLALVFREITFARVTSVTGESWCPVQPDLKDRNVVVAVVLGQQGDLRASLPERLLWVADFKVSELNLNSLNTFIFTSREYPSTNISICGEEMKERSRCTFPNARLPLQRRESVLAARDMMGFQGQTHM